MWIIAPHPGCFPRALNRTQLKFHRSGSSPWEKSNSIFRAYFARDFKNRKFRQTSISELNLNFSIKTLPSMMRSVKCEERPGACQLSSCFVKPEKYQAIRSMKPHLAQSLYGQTFLFSSFRLNYDDSQFMPYSASIDDNLRLLQWQINEKKIMTKWARESKRRKLETCARRRA